MAVLAPRSFRVDRCSVGSIAQVFVLNQTPIDLIVDLTPNLTPNLTLAIGSSGWLTPRVRSWLAGAIGRVLISTGLITTSLSAPAWGQSIAPAPDEAGPQVTIDRSGDHDHYGIQGGQRVGANLFQSFERLGLASGETATFWVTPDVSRVLALSLIHI